MSQPAAAAANADQAAAGGNRQQGGIGSFIQSMIRMLLMYQLFKWFTGSGTPKGAVPGSKGGVGVTSKLAIAPKFLKNHPFDVHFYISEQAEWFDAVAQGTDPVWYLSDIPLADQTVDLQKNIQYTPSELVQTNGSVYVHAVFTPPGASPSAAEDDFDPSATFGRTSPLNIYLKKPKSKEGVHLLGGKNATTTIDGEASGEDNVIKEDDKEEEDEDTQRPILSYLKPNITLTMVDDFGTIPSPIPPHLAKLLNIDQVGGGKSYWPHTWYNDFWLLRDHLVPINNTVTTVTLHLSLHSLPSWKYALYSSMDQSFSMQQSFGAMGEGESDDIKRIFLEGNPWLLGVTVCVSTLHSVFDALAFKNDIGFWKDNKSMKGLSARSILINAACQLIIFFYLLDNETSIVVLASAGIGTLIEFWKVTKAMDVKLARCPPGSKLPYKLTIKDRASYTSSKTAEYDATAMQYLSYALYPLVAGYGVYSLVYQTHKSWYSWVLYTLVGAVYAFGFILMCPQLYLNYKLKSVAHLPWRQMTYKFLNTIIDDLFAFVIKMPLLHRLSVFRDDLIFLIYIYQRWIYRVDKSRPNEFGYAEEQEEEEEKKEEKKEGRASGSSDKKEEEKETKKDK